jgi:hypothetical protein
VQEEAREIYSFGSEPIQIPEPLSAAILFSPQTGSRTLSRPLSAVNTYTWTEKHVCGGDTLSNADDVFRSWWYPTVLLMCNVYDHFHTLILYDLVRHIKVIENI